MGDIGKIKKHVYMEPLDASTAPSEPLAETVPIAVPELIEAQNARETVSVN